MLELNALGGGYGQAAVVRDVTLRVAEGERIALLGRNGTGKTTLLRTVFGLADRQGGEVHLAGRPVPRGRPDLLARRGAALMPEDRGVFPTLTVAENLSLATRAGFVPAVDPHEIFPLLTERRRQPAGTLSGGQKQQLGIARSMLSGQSLTSTPDMGMLTAAESSRYGIARNPWNTAYSPGGSSDGAAAAVAAGLAPVAHANDGGGSIRMPSSCCGLVGLKPSRGRVPQYLAAWEHATVEGAITRAVRDAAALLDVTSVPDSLVMYGAPAPERPFSEEVGRESEPLRVGLLLQAPTGLPVDPVCVAAAERTGRLLESLGHAVFPVSPRFFTEEAGLGYAQTILDAALWTAPYDRPELAEPHLRFRMECARTRHSGEYTRTAALLQQEAVEVRAQWGRDFDVLLTPTLACPPPPAGTCLAEANADPGGFRMTENRMISFTAVCNITGLPAISLPLHTSPDGLPVGCQLIGGPWDEATLLRLASALEELSDWTVRRPEHFE